MTEPVPAVPARRATWFWVSAAVGWLVIGYGVRGLLHHHVDTRPSNLARFAFGGVILHDMIVAPAVTLLGVAVSRAVPARVRAIVQGAMIVSGMLVLFSWPLVRGYAHALHNPSSLPHNYTANLALALGCVWAGAAVLSVRALRSPRSASRSRPAPPPRS